MKNQIDFCKKLYLAPMAGVTDFAFRLIARQNGADLSCTEMVSAKGLVYESEKTKELLFCDDCENPKIVQLFGSEPDVFRQACKHPLISAFDCLDINMGCPAPKIVKNGEGSALMLNPEKAKQIISTCVENFDGPITVKFRKGYDENHINFQQFARMCQEAGASAITIHGRTRTQGYSGKVDLDAIKKVKDCVFIPVIGNGDVVDEKSFQAMLSTGVDSVMIGRGAFGNPCVFNSIKNQTTLPIKEIAHKHANMLLQKHTEKHVNLIMRKHLLWYLSGISGVAEKKRELATCPDLKTALHLFDKIIDKIVL